MTYYEHYQTAHEECDLIAMMKHDTKYALIFGNNPDRIKAIEDAGNRVAKERGWDLCVSEPIKLLPCPLCGDTYIIMHHTKGGYYTIGCNTVNCIALHCEGKLFRTEKEAIEAWNRRVPAYDEYEV